MYVFYTNQSIDEIKKYYLEEVRKNQWIVVRDEDDGLICIKGDYQLSLGYKNPSVQGRYDIILRWPATIR